MWEFTLAFSLHLPHHLLLLLCVQAAVLLLRSILSLCSPQLSVFGKNVFCVEPAVTDSAFCSSSPGLLSYQPHMFRKSVEEEHHSCKHGATCSYFVINHETDSLKHAQKTALPAETDKAQRYGHNIRIAEPDVLNEGALLIKKINFE